jgi:hypothetical protein
MHRCMTVWMHEKAIAKFEEPKRFMRTQIRWFEISSV